LESAKSETVSDAMKIIFFYSKTPGSLIFVVRTSLKVYNLT